jgi:hypothetical protein
MILYAVIAMNRAYVNVVSVWTTREQAEKAKAIVEDYKFTSHDKPRWDKVEIYEWLVDDDVYGGLFEWSEC